MEDLIMMEIMRTMVLRDFDILLLMWVQRKKFQERPMEKKM